MNELMTLIESKLATPPEHAGNGEVLMKDRALVFAIVSSAPPGGILGLPSADSWHPCPIQTHLNPASSS